MPTLSGTPDLQRSHDHLYWEFFEQGRSAQAVRGGDWKAVRRLIFDGTVALYDLAADPGETLDLATELPDRVAELTEIMSTTRTPAPEWEAAGGCAATRAATNATQVIPAVLTLVGIAPRTPRQANRTIRLPGCYNPEYINSVR